MEDNEFEHRVKIMCLFAHVIFIFLRLQVAVMYKNYFESQFTLIFPVVSDLLKKIKYCLYIDNYEY